MPADLTKDPVFMSLGLEDRASYIAERDPEFAKLEPSLQIDFVARFGGFEREQEATAHAGKQALAGFREGGARLTGAIAKGFEVLPGESTHIAPFFRGRQRHLEERAREIPSPRSFAQKLARGAGGVLPDIAGIASATGLMGGNPVAGFIGYGQAIAPEDASLKERIRTAGKDAALGALFPLTQAWGRAGRAATLAPAGGLMAAGEGGGLEDVAAGGLLMGGLAALPPSRAFRGALPMEPITMPGPAQGPPWAPNRPITEILPPEPAARAALRPRGSAAPSKAEIDARASKVAAWDALDPHPKGRPTWPDTKNVPQVPAEAASRIARVAAGEPVPGEVPQRVGNIRLDKISSAEDIKRIIQVTGEELAPRMEQARAVRTWEESAKLESLLGMSMDDLLKRRKGEAYNDFEILGASEVLGRSVNEFKAAARVARENPTPENLAKVDHALNVNAAIQEQIAGVRAEAGRALNILRRVSDYSKEAKSIEQLVSQAGGKDRLLEIARGMELLETPSEMAKFARDAAPATTMEKVREAWVNGLLSGFPTHVANTTSNTIFNVQNLIEETAAWGFGMVTRSPDRVLLGEIPQRLFATRYGLSQGLRLAHRAWAEGTEGHALGKVENPKYRAIGGKTGEVFRMPGRALMAEDEFFKAIAMQQELAAQAYRMAHTEGLRGRARNDRITEILLNPPEAMTAKARQRARELTFTNELGTFGRATQRWINASPYAPFLVPFMRTPTNIFKEAVKRSFFAPILGETRADWRAGGRSRDLVMARIAVGSTIGAMAAKATADGILTGGGPRDPAERAALYDTGWMPYSMKVGDKYYSYARLEPFSTVIGMAADFAELRPMLSDDDANAIAAKIALSFSTNMTSKTFTRGPSEFLRALDDPGRYGESWVESLTRSMLPYSSAIGNVARVIDPVMRDPSNPFESILTRIPYASKSVSPRRSRITGEEVVREGPVGPDLISPFYQSTATNDPVAQEIVALGVKVPKPQRSFTIGEDEKGKAVKDEMTDNEYNFFVEHVGRTAHEYLSTMVGTPEWASAPEDEKTKMILGAYEIGREEGGQLVLFARIRREMENLAGGKK